MSQFTGKDVSVPEISVGAAKDNDAVRAKRRRFLLGAAAALPSVYTLTSGAQTAVASGLSCLTRGAQANPTRITTAPDTWYRSQVKAGSAGQSTTKNAFCIMDNQNACADALKPDWSASQSYWYVNGQRTMVPQGEVRNIQGGRTTAYGLVYVDQKGTVATLDPMLQPGLQPATNSCMNSIIGSAISKLG